MEPDLTNEAATAPLTGPGGRWQAAAEAGSILHAMSHVSRLSDGRTIPVDVVFSRPPVHVHVANELAEFVLEQDSLRCTVMTGLGEVYCGRIASLLPFVLPAFAGADVGATITASLGDEGFAGRVLAFSSIVPDYLVPDPYFMASNGYQAEAAAFGQGPHWNERSDQAYWRGTDTGTFRYRNLADAPRVAVCRLAREVPELVDAKITAIEPRADEADKRSYYEQNGFLGPYEPQTEIARYRYQVDIDGNTNTWSSLFLKLLTGSPVLKVDSECGFRQWYYSRLIPHVHFVPVKADMSDFVAKLSWLRANPDHARRIGEAGRAFALELTIEREVAKAVSEVKRLIDFNRRVKL